MSYYALDVNTVIDYVRTRPMLNERFPPWCNPSPRRKLATAT